MNRSLFSMAACLAFITAGPAAAQERFSLSGDRIAIYNVAGEVAVEAGTGANVIVEVARGGDDAGRLTIYRN